MEKVLKDLKNYHESDEGKPYFNKDKYEVFDYDFNKVMRISGPIYFIDGGNQEVISDNSFCISFNKVAYASFDHTKKKVDSKNFWSSSILKKDMKYKTRFMDEMIEFDAYDPRLESSGNRVSPLKISNLIRKIGEFMFAKDLCDSVKDSIIVLDGILLSNHEILKKYLNELYYSAEKNNNIICSVAKTSNLVTTTGRSLNEVVSSKKNGAFYVKIAKSKFDEHNATIYLLRLHERSDHVFRFEIGRTWEKDAEKVIGVLADNSKDPVFLGYPYGLVVADELARVSNNETEFMRTKFSVELSKKDKMLAKTLFKKNPHGVLDSIKF